MILDLTRSRSAIRRIAQITRCRSRRIYANCSDIELRRPGPVGSFRVRTMVDRYPTSVLPSDESGRKGTLHASRLAPAGRHRDGARASANLYPQGSPQPSVRQRCDCRICAGRSRHEARCVTCSMRTSVSVGPSIFNARGSQPMEVVCWPAIFAWTESRDCFRDCSDRMIATSSVSVTPLQGSFSLRPSYHFIRADRGGMCLLVEGSALERS